MSLFSSVRAGLVTTYPHWPTLRYDDQANYLVQVGSVVLEGGSTVTYKPGLSGTIPPEYLATLSPATLTTNAQNVQAGIAELKLLGYL